MPAIRTCFVGAHTYAVQPASADSGEALELYDPDGSGRIVARVLQLVSTIAMSLHGQDGEHLVKTVHADLLDALKRLWDMIAAQ